MAKQNFDQSLRYVLIDEGGNDDDPQDHGGRTSRGITQREYDSWCKLNGETGGDVWEATSEEVSDIYHSQYWNPYCDKLPAGLDYVFFDTSVNAGRSQAVKSFQKALGVSPDGMMGNVTLSSISEADPAKLIHDVCDVRRTFYQNLKQFPRYGKGWLARVDHCERGALAMTKVDFSDAQTTSPTNNSPKADGTDVSTTTISPETSTGAAAGAGGIIGVLNSLKDTLQQYSGEIKYVTYALLGIAVVTAGYGIYGFMHRSTVKAAT